MLQEIRLVLAANAEIFGLANLLLGALIGHRTALFRDRRREFNDAARPVREWLLSEIDNPSPYARRPSAIEIDAFTSRLPRRLRRRFNAADQRQQQERRQQEIRDSLGGVSYRNPEPIIAALSGCLKYTRLR